MIQLEDMNVEHREHLTKLLCDRHTSEELYVYHTVLQIACNSAWNHNNQEGEIRSTICLGLLEKAIEEREKHFPKTKEMP